MKSLPPPVAVLACNDVRGRQVLEASMLAGLRVPDDVAVIGVDDDQLICNLSNATPLAHTNGRAVRFVQGV